MTKYSTRHRSTLRQKDELVATVDTRSIEGRSFTGYLLEVSGALSAGQYEILDEIGGTRLPILAGGTSPLGSITVLLSHENAQQLVEGGSGVDEAKIGDVLLNKLFS